MTTKQPSVVLAGNIEDPDQGLRIRKPLQDRLLRQKTAVERGERGDPFKAVAKRLGITWPKETLICSEFVHRRTR